MSEAEEIVAPDFFELTVARFTPEPRTEEYRIHSAQELDERLGSVLAESMIAIGLGCVAEGADCGSFFLLLSGERALVHLMEGPCIAAWDPKLTAPQEQTVRFRDDAGFWHEVPFAGTIAREQGLRALQHWLPRGEKLPELRWDRA